MSSQKNNTVLHNVAVGVIFYALFLVRLILHEFALFFSEKYVEKKPKNMQEPHSCSTQPLSASVIRFHATQLSPKPAIRLETSCSLQREASKPCCCSVAPGSNTLERMSHSQE